MKYFLTFFLCLFVSGALSQQADWRENKTLLRLKLENSRGKKFRLRDVGYYKGAVIVFLSPECPLSLNYTKNLRELHQRFSEEHILFLGVYAGNALSKQEVERFRTHYQLPFDLLLDTEYALARSLGAGKTPEVFLTDPWGGTHYSGAIDDWAIALGKVKDTPEQAYLELALEKWLMNEPIWPVRTTAVGCLIEIPEQP